MRAQNEDLAARQHDLVESSRELEATLLETIETLNAAVEARDPYTAGHSQRVRRVSLAIGGSSGSRRSSSARSRPPHSSTTSGRSGCPTRSSRSRAASIGRKPRSCAST
jgi:hypothetical protein